MSWRLLNFPIAIIGLVLDHVSIFGIPLFYIIIQEQHLHNRKDVNYSEFWNLFGTLGVDKRPPDIGVFGYFLHCIGLCIATIALFIPVLIVECTITLLTNFITLLAAVIAAPFKLTYEFLKSRELPPIENISSNKLESASKDFHDTFTRLDAKPSLQSSDCFWNKSKDYLENADKGAGRDLPPAYGDGKGTAPLLPAYSCGR